MARGGFLGRIARAIGIGRAPSPPPERPPPERPPEPPEPRGQYRDIWREQRGKGNYRKHLKVFHSMVDPVTEDEKEVRPELWESYIKNIVKGEGRFRRNDTANRFWRDSGIDPADFNWQKWREAMGFTGKRRSRTT